MRSRVVATIVALAASLALPASSPSAQAAASGPVTTRPLTNLAHLDFLGDSVQPPPRAGHTTYRLDRAPDLRVLWTYAEPNPDGTFRRLGGGTYHADTNTYNQGAFNSDDMARAAVVYLRHWQSTGATSSRDAAFGLLRGVAYFQTVSGPNAGNEVLWMQPDGTLHRAPTNPADSPSPSDSGVSYWMARAIWAFGEGYAAFRTVDPAFAAFLRDRIELAVAALDREVLNRYGDYLQIDGRRTPAWLIVDGADATAEAVLGLSAYVGAGGSAVARTALKRFSAGIAALSAGDARTWPFGAVLPWALSRSDWHAWASQMPAALARASVALGDSHLAEVAMQDSSVFDPWLLTSGGPDNGRIPTRTDATQIAYGLDSRVESLIATAQATGASGPRRLAGMTAAWFFGANAAGVPAYDPATGRTIDGIAADGTVNQNSGAESTIHGLLAMIALDANPDIAAIARSAVLAERVGTTTLEAENAALAGAASAVVPGSAWTGEALYSGGAFAELAAGGSATFTVAPGTPALVLPVVDLQPGSSAVTAFRTPQRRLGSVRSGAIGPQGDSPAPGALLPVTLPLRLTAGATTLTATTTASGADVARLDAVMLEPLVSRYVLGGAGHGTALLRSAATTSSNTTVSVPGQGMAEVETYDGTGRLVATGSSAATDVPVTVLAGGFTVVRR